MLITHGSYILICITKRLYRFVSLVGLALQSLLLISFLSQTLINRLTMQIAKKLLVRLDKIINERHKRE